MKRKDAEDDEQTILVREDSPFHAIQFHRIILDEAHTIKVVSSSIHLGHPMADVSRRVAKPAQQRRASC